MTPIEERYRSLLRILPAAYRADWEEEMVATFLAGMASDDPEDAEYVAEFGRPGLSEVASVVGLAVRLRLPALGYARTDRDRLMGDAVRIVALVGLLVNAATGAVAVGAHLWLIGKLPGFTQPDVWVGPLPGVVPMTRVLLVATALPAFAALIFGHRHAARLLASISLGTVMLTAVGDLIAGYPPMAGRWLAILLNLLIFAALCAHHGDAPPLPRRPWLLALPVAIGVALTMVVATASFRVTWWLVDWPAICCLLMALGLVAHMTTRRRPEWSVALAMLAGVVLLQRLVTLPEFAGSATAGQQPVVVWVGLAEIAAVVAAGLPVAWLARRVWRRLPAEAVPA